MPDQKSRHSPRVKPSGSHHCPQCDKVYERPDHLARHLDSHRNERTFQCPVCWRGFNRRDVLQRHQVVHEKNTAEGKTLKHQKERAIEACEACATAKLSCDNERPCNRCKSKGTECTAKRPKPSKRNKDRAVYTPVSPRNWHQDESISRCSESIATPISRSNEISMPQETTGAHGIYTQIPPTKSTMQLDQLLPNQGPNQTDFAGYQDMNSFPAFFEQIMLPDLPGVNENQGPQQPRDVFDFMQDTDFTVSDIDLFGNNFIPDLDMIIDPQFQIQGDGSDQDLMVDSDGSARLRVEAFQRSLWLWIPEKNQNAFSEEGRIPLRDTDMTTAISSSHRTPLDTLKIQGKLTSRARDDMFQLVVRTAGSRLLVSAFPAAEHLDTLIKIGIAKKTETDSWIHPYTLYHQELRPELLTAMVAAGCVCCRTPSINKTGIILQEIARASLAQLVEYDNSVLRDLQYLQASMMWLDIGVFCGYKRKMQIAESYLQPLCTALRRAGTFDRSAYSAITPFSGLDNEESLEDIWHAWVKQESLKRLVYHLFEHDIQVATTMNRPAITCYAELTLPFPAHRDLWLAPTATAWKNGYIEKYGRHVGASELSLRDVLSDPSLLNHPPPDVDAGIATAALLHGLASQVWEFRQQVLLSRCCASESRAMNRLWLQSRQDDIYSILQSFQGDLFSASAVATLLKEFTMMYLHIDVDAIQRFAGKLGELDAKRAYSGLRDWSRTKEARIAVWHAGQVFRTARLVPPCQLRGFDCLAIYHAALTLWVYGLLQCGENRHVEVNTPVTDVDGAIFVCIDGPECQLTKAFVTRNIGQPGLTFDTVPRGHDFDSHQGFCELSRPRSIMVIARQIFESNYPGASPADNLPPLVNNLRDLMQDLGDLP